LIRLFLGFLVFFGLLKYCGVWSKVDLCGCWYVVDLGAMWCGRGLEACALIVLWGLCVCLCCFVEIVYGLFVLCVYLSFGELFFCLFWVLVWGWLLFWSGLGGVSGCVVGRLCDCYRWLGIAFELVFRVGVWALFAVGLLLWCFFMGFVLGGFSGSGGKLCSG